MNMAQYSSWKEDMKTFPVSQYGSTQAAFNAAQSFLNPWTLQWRYRYHREPAVWIKWDGKRQEYFFEKNPIYHPNKVWEDIEAMVEQEKVS